MECICFHSLCFLGGWPSSETFSLICVICYCHLFMKPSATFARIIEKYSFIQQCLKNFQQQRFRYLSDLSSAAFLVIKFFIMWISGGTTCDCCFLAYHLSLQRKVWQGCLCRYLSSRSRLILDYNLTSFWLHRKVLLLTVNPSCPLDVHCVPQHLYHLVIWLSSVC